MNDKLYTIPVTDAFKSAEAENNCTCPFCSMYESLEKDAIEFTLGPSYMEDDIRAVTDEKGFCEKHVKMLYKGQNRLGLALMLKSHAEKTTKALEKYSRRQAVSGGLFKKKGEVNSNFKNFYEKLKSSCFVCERIDAVYERYIATVFYLYEKEKDFREMFKGCKGICLDHFAELTVKMDKYLGSRFADEFISDLNSIFFEDMHTTIDDLSWFIDKFDYRNADAPWKNSKDALPRMAQKLYKGLHIEE